MSTTLGIRRYRTLKFLFIDTSWLINYRVADNTKGKKELEKILQSWVKIKLIDWTIEQKIRSSFSVNNVESPGSIWPTGGLESLSKGGLQSNQISHEFMQYYRNRNPLIILLQLIYQQSNL